jgi:hypothetical protein
VSAIFAKPAASEMVVKQFPSLVKLRPADLDRQMAPVGVEDVEGIVVDIRHRLFTLDVVLGVHIPHRRLGATNQD